MALIESLLVRLGMQTGDFERGADRAAKRSSALERGMGGLKNAIAGLAGAFTAAATFDFLKDSFLAAEQAEQATARLGAVLKATGGAAGFSAETLGFYADELDRVTHLGGDMVTNAQAVLATFKNVRGQAFLKGTEAAADMAAVMGGDLNSAITQVGKALNDPMEGISALSRVGVTFTDAQKKMIAGFQESNDLASAQGIILAELASEFGGAAAAIVTDSQRIAATWGDVKEEVGFALKEFMSLDAAVGAAHGMKDLANMFNEGFAEINRQGFWETMFGTGSKELGAVTKEELAKMEKWTGNDATGTNRPTEKGAEMLEKMREELELGIKTWDMTAEQIERYKLKLENVDPVTRQSVKALQEQREALKLEKEASDYIKELEKMNATMGMSEAEVKAYEFSQKKVNAQLIEGIKYLDLSNSAKKLQAELDKKIIEERAKLAGKSGDIAALVAEGLAPAQEHVLNALNDQVEALEKQNKQMEDLKSKAEEFNEKFGVDLSNIPLKIRDEIAELAKQGADALAAFDKELIDRPTLHRIGESMEADVLKLAMEEVPEAKFSGAMEEGSSEAFSAINRFQAEGDRKSEVERLQQGMLRQLEETVRLLREQNANLQVVDDLG